MSAYLHHVTLTTGHYRRSPRAEVSEATIGVLRPHLARALEQDGDELPLGLVGYRLKAERVGGALLGTVSWGDTPIATLGVARRGTESRKLWRLLHETAGASALTDPDQAPAAPWCGVFLWPTLALAPGVTEWLGDYERCVAWTWIEGRA